MPKKMNPLLSLATSVVLDYLAGQKTKAASPIPELADLPCVREICAKAGSVTVIIGRRDLGKSVCGYRLAEILGRPVYAISPEQHPPVQVREITLPELSSSPPPWATLFLDDLPVYMSSRDYGDELIQQVERLVPVVRHKRKLHLIFATQLTSFIDKYALDADLVILKAPSVLYADIERPFVKKLHDQASEYWRGKSEYWLKRHCYVISHSFQGLARINLPWLGKEKMYPPSH